MGYDRKSVKRRVYSSYGIYSLLILQNIADLGGDMHPHASERHRKTQRCDRDMHSSLLYTQSNVADVQRNERIAAE